MWLSVQGKPSCRFRASPTAVTERVQRGVVIGRRVGEEERGAGPEGQHPDTGAGSPVSAGGRLGPVWAWGAHTLLALGLPWVQGPGLPDQDYRTMECPGRFQTHGGLP